jgi:hypothetical protein
MSTEPLHVHLVQNPGRRAKDAPRLGPDGKPTGRRSEDITRNKRRAAFLGGAATASWPAFSAVSAPTPLLQIVVVSLGAALGGSVAIMLLLLSKSENAPSKPAWRAFYILAAATLVVAGFSNDGDQDGPSAGSSIPPTPTSVPGSLDPATSTSVVSTSIVDQAGPMPPIVSVVNGANCTIHLTSIIPQRGTGCDARVRLEPFGSPTTSVSAWAVTDHAWIVITAPARVNASPIDARGSDPTCFWDVPAVRHATPDGVSPSFWEEQASVLVLDAAPPGTEIVLYSECAGPTGLTGASLDAGWTVTVE